MSGFEFLFGFFSLLMGIAASNVATGFAVMWRDRGALKVGVCTPLLALVVLFGVMNAWITFWTERALVQVSAPWLIAAALVALPYVFASQVMFPASPSASLEDHYLAHRRIILLAITLPPLAGQATNLAFGSDPPSGWKLGYFVVRIGLPLLLLALPQRWAQRLGLGALSLWQLTGLLR